MPMIPSFMPRRIAAILSRPLGMMPVSTHSRALALVCNRLFAQPLREGECEFLRGRTLEIQVRDLRVCCRISLDDHGFCISRVSAADVSIEGGWAEFLQLASRQEDPDTLFFSRRLRLQGDTELGLQVKNFLDAQEPPSALLHLLQRINDQLSHSA